MTLHVRVAQLNFTVGDLQTNADKIIAAATEAHRLGAQLLITPELSLCGYPAEDWLLRPAFVQDCEQALVRIMEQTVDLKGLYVLVGHPEWVQTPAQLGFSRSVAQAQVRNVVSVLHQGRCVARYAKRRLPNYQVFDEQRYFTPGTQAVCVDVPDAHGQVVRVGLLICEDTWFAQGMRDVQQLGAEVVVVVNASPFHLGKGLEREQAMRERVLETGLPLIYVHGVGGQDELIFEGRSFVLDANGHVQGRAPGFYETLFAVQMERQDQGWALCAEVHDWLSDEADLWQALVLGVRDYIHKNRFSSVILGLSGGIDSALVLAIAVDALGKDKVRAVMMPSPYTASISWVDARDMAQRLGVQYDEIGIEPSFKALQAALAPLFVGCAQDTTEENLQARIRGTLLMAMSNKWGCLVLTTGNKSEMATGYCTLYGDMAGGFAVIKDLLKTRVYALARWRNQNDPFEGGQTPIPERILTRAPSAELRPDQTDQDSLPPYDILDAIIERYVERNQSSQDIVQAGFSSVDVERVVRLIRLNEYKRQQAPVGIRVTHRSFGKDWRYPISHRYSG